ncbi:D-glycerate dehydrogenase [Paenibacillus sp. LHD-117]|uniref:2-hydroxyacid dehydrogenase n=1 Tax=Paenibacillus sp. LHD-117 TaxID=3071412 RepID=UPI0027E059C1|nr:D-glycerate dehydrogenase [Paenibacillus sp. LHD-117]MDQ6418027.1 D-glycerate dehydrogenase [Paenibacillus sp. LHD-117]
MKPHVFVDRPLAPEVEQSLAAHCTLDIWTDGDTIPRDELHRRLSNAEGFLTAGRRIDAALLEAAPKLRAVSTISVGYNHFDIDAMKRFGVIGTHTPYVLDETVADLTFALMLGAARRVAELDHYVREGKWKRGDGEQLFGVDVHHAVLGIIGMGRIGEAVAKRARFGFDMTVQYYNRSRKPDAEQRYEATYAELDELLATSDFVVMLAPLTEETKDMIGREQFAKMKASAIYINVSRGATVDEDALIDALENGVIRGAGLDVYKQEPIDGSHPLLRFPNVLALPHIGSATTKTRIDMAKAAANNLIAALNGETPPYLVPEFRS